MSIEMDVAKQIIHERIIEGKDFSLDELEKEIINEGGICRVAPAVTIKDYLKILEEQGAIKYNPYTNNYIVLNGKLEDILGIPLNKN